MTAATNARWVGAIQASKVAVQLLSILILARMLSAQEFGLVAIASVATNFALLFRDLGTAAALIQKADLDEETKSTAFWMNCALGLLLGVAMLASAPLIAALMKAPDVRGLLLVIACVFPIAGTSIVHQALLERASMFSVVARIEIVSLCVGFITVIAAAWLGAGAYSLVLQSLVIAILSTVQLWLSAHWMPRIVWSATGVRQLWKFSGNLFAFNLTNYFARNADNLIIGRVLGPAALGAYSLAYRTMLFPLQNLTFVAGRALFPVMSRRQGAVTQVADLYFRTLGIIAFFTAPLMAGLFVLRVPFVDVVFGDRWADIATIFAWLAPTGFIQSLLSSGGPVFMTFGRTGTLFRVSMVATIVHVTGFFIGVRWGVTGVATCYFITNVIMFFPTMLLILKCVDARLSRLWQAVRRPLFMTLLMALLLYFLRPEILKLPILPVFQLLLLILAGSGFYLSMAWLRAGALERDMLRLLYKKA